MYAEKDGDSFIIKRGYDLLIKNKRVLIVEDILTTGGSVKKLVEVARTIPCEIVGVAALCMWKRHQGNAWQCSCITFPYRNIFRILGKKVLAHFASRECLSIRRLVKEKFLSGHLQLAGAHSNTYNTTRFNNMKT